MNTTQNDQRTQATIISIIILIGALIIIFFSFSEKDGSVEKHLPNKESVENVQTKTLVKDVEKWIQELPDSSFKSNLLTVFGAEYGGDSDELNKLMKAFIEIRLQELTKEKSI